MVFLHSCSLGWVAFFPLCIGWVAFFFPFNFFCILIWKKWFFYLFFFLNYYFFYCPFGLVVGWVEFFHEEKSWTLKVTGSSRHLSLCKRKIYCVSPLHSSELSKTMVPFSLGPLCYHPFLLPRTPCLIPRVHREVILLAFPVLGFCLGGGCFQTAGWGLRADGTSQETLVVRA